MEITPPNCESSDCYTPSPCNDKNKIFLTNQELTNDIICLNSLKPEIKGILNRELILLPNA